LREPYYASFSRKNNVAMVLFIYWLQDTVCGPEKLFLLTPCNPPSSLSVAAQKAAWEI
jgi:hypothetical protein